MQLRNDLLFRSPIKEKTLRYSLGLFNSFDAHCLKTNRRVVVITRPGLSTSEISLTSEKMIFSPLTL